MSIPRATVRLQLNRSFDFAAANEHVPYFAALGISHVYLSPIAMATTGSMHGYDAVDPSVISPELGGEQGFTLLTDTLRKHEMSIILDIVPNHMAAELSNVWWCDVLARGQASPYAHYFDIEWDAPDANGKLLLPVLATSLDKAIDANTIDVVTRIGGSGVGIHVNDAVYPTSRESVQWLLRDVGESDAMLALKALRDNHARMRTFLQMQPYLLIGWRENDRMPNYRRFFDINGLVALSMHREEVFDAVHAMLLRLIERGWVDGLRIDHIDGLADPAGYLQTLRQRMDACMRVDAAGNPSRLMLYVEKILATHEALPADWPVDGTTGYDFMREVGALLHDPHGYAQLLVAWASQTESSDDFDHVERQARRELLQSSLKPELLRCVRALHRAIQASGNRDFTEDAIEVALTDVLEHLRIYRTYLGKGDATQRDRLALSKAFDAADRCNDAARKDVRALIRNSLLDPVIATADANRLTAGARIRFEQLASALNAKAVEDTGFYRFGPLLSLNEVGSQPHRLMAEPAHFHQAMQNRSEHWPHALLATATHDHKRGADTRARLAILSERPQWFVQVYRTLLDALGDRTQPSRAALWMLCQTILAAWPLDLGAHDDASMPAFAHRIEAWLLKAEREAKLHTSWAQPDAVYERACRVAVNDILCAPAYVALRQAMHTAVRSLDALGALNGLAMTTLHLTAPGVPDIYQGTEYWDLSLVDPDNRDQVDYAARQASLDLDPTLEELLSDYRSGAIKQHLAYRLLQLRKTWPELFAEGNYVPLAVAGERAAHVLAFMREHAGKRCVVAVPRCCAEGMRDAQTPLLKPDFWTDTNIAIALHDGACTFTDLFTHVKRSADPAAWTAAALFSQWPVAVLISASRTDECEAFFRRKATTY